MDFGRTVRLGSEPIPTDFGHRHPDYFYEEDEGDRQAMEEEDYFKALFEEGPPFDPWEDTANE